MEEEQLLQSFLQKMKIEDDGDKVFQVPSKYTPTTNWNRCLMMKIMSDELVHESRFAARIKRDMRLQPGTNIQSQGKNVFLVEFLSEGDLLRNLDKGAWDFNGDVMVLKRVHSLEQMSLMVFDEIEVWVQVHGIPPCAMLVDGIPAMLARVGTPLSDARCFFFNGRKCYKVKVLVPLGKAVKDELVMENKDIGLKYEVYLVYENVKKICLFCGFIGHTKENCPDRMLLFRLRANPSFKEVDDLWRIEDKAHLWVNDITEVPIFQENVVVENRKGDFVYTGSGSGGIRDKSPGIVNFLTIPGVLKGVPQVI